MNSNFENRMEMLVKRGNRRRLLKRAVALMSAVVMLFTVNTLKRTATTLERIPMCGFEYEHTHVPECFDELGNLICQLHEHTDACYQQQPVKEPQADAVEGDVDEVEFDLGGEAPEQVEEAVETEQPAEEACVVYGYELGAEAVRLSDTIAAAELPVALSDIEIVGMVDGEAQDWVRITPEDGDYIVRAAQDFAAAELAVVTAEDIQTVMLLNGVKAEEVVEENAEEVTEEATEEATEEITEEIVEEAVEQVGEETVEKIVEETTEQVEEETAEETTEQVEEVAEEVAEETEEASEEAIEAAEQVEEITEEVTEETSEEVAEEVTEETVEETAEPTEEVTEETAEEATEEAEDKAEAEATEETAEQTENVTEEPTEETTEESGEVTEEAVEQADEESEEATEEAAEMTVDEPTEETEEVTEEATEETAEETTEEAEPAEGTEEVTEEPTEETTGESEEVTEETAEPTEEVTEEAEQAEEAEEPTETPEQAETSAETSAAEYAATIDLTGAEYPLSLRALLAQAERVLDVEVEEVAQVEAPAELPDEAEAAEAENTEVDETVEITDAAETTEAIETTETVEAADTVEPAEPAQQSAAAEWTLEYDDALIAVEAGEDDYAVAPLADFESTQIIVNNGSRYALTLVNCTLPQAAEAAPEIAYPAQSFEGRTDSVKVSVTAAEGAFPEGAAMVVADVEDEQTLSDIEQTVGEDFVEVKRVHAVDISFYNAEGEEIEPLIPISVVMTVDEIEQQQDAVVVHVDSEGAAEVVEQSEAPEADGAELNLNVEMPAAPAEETAAPIEENIDTEDEMTEEAEPEDAEVRFEADSFSVYAVVVTETIETRYIAADGATWNISVGYGPEAGIPGGATLAVRELEGEESEDCMAQTAKLLKGRETITLARFFDITILDEAGNEVQPAEPVKVDVALAEGSEDAVKAVHFAEEGLEVIEASREEDAVRFEAEGFSVYGIVYTVDFHYDFGDAHFDYGIPGGDCASLSALVDALGIARDDPETGDDELAAFMAEIADVTFSNPELVRVSPVTEGTTVGALREALGLESRYSAALTDEDREAIEARALTAPDWALFSLEPFTTEESLTVAMANGDSFAIAVTDAQIATRVLAADGQTYKITLTFGPEAGIPLDAELRAYEIEQGCEAYENYLKEAMNAINAHEMAGKVEEEIVRDDTEELSLEHEEEAQKNEEQQVDYARFFDIEILVDDQKIEPAAPVQVKITCDDPIEVGEEDKLVIVHFGEAETEVIDDVAIDESGKEAVYEQGSFSTSALIQYRSSGSWSVPLTNNTEYAIVIQYEGKFYVIQNDGTLERETSYRTGDPSGWRPTYVRMEHPMTWLYMEENGNHYLRHAYDAAHYGGNQLADQWLYRYICPKDSSGIQTDEKTGTAWNGYATINDKKGNSAIQYICEANGSGGTRYVLGSNDNGTMKYLGVQRDADGSLRLVGNITDKSQAATVLFAIPEFVGDTYADNNTVNHIDISVRASARYAVQLEPGKQYELRKVVRGQDGNIWYYDQNDTKTINVGENEVKFVTLMVDEVPVTVPEMKNASIMAYRMENGKKVEMDEAFYVTGYSANAPVSSGEAKDTAQVRIEGVFKVSTVDDYTREIAASHGLPFDSNSMTNSNKDSIYCTERMKEENRVYYNISYETEVDFPFIVKFDNSGNMLEPQENGTEYMLWDTENNCPMRADDVPVMLNANFDYWDERNTCPAIKDGAFNNGANWYFPQLDPLYNVKWWKQGQIIDFGYGKPENSGMDFRMGGDEQEDLTPSLTIYKTVLDTDGNVISVREAPEYVFEIYGATTEGVYQPQGTGDALLNAGTDEDHPAANISGQTYITGHTYKHIDTQFTQVGETGTSVVYENNLPQGLYYIKETPKYKVKDYHYTGNDHDEIAWNDVDITEEELIDTEGKKYVFDHAQINTEYVKRGSSFKYHYSQDYTGSDQDYWSVPETAGAYYAWGGSSFNQQQFEPFLDFFVYNYYRPKTYPVKVKKVDAANPSADTGLAGAEFDLYGPYESSLSEDDARKAIKVNDIAIVTPGDGIVSIGDLQSGYYYLYETKAPDGYIKLSDPVEIVVDSSKENDQHAEISYTQTYNGQATLSPEGHSIEPPSSSNGDCYVLTVTNTAGARLPSTGGMGTGMYYALGTLLVLAAVALMIARRRAQAEE